MGTNAVSAEDQKRYAAARVAGRRDEADPSYVRLARYVPSRDVVELQFGGGAVIFIPRASIVELADAPAAELKSLDVSPAGDALACRPLDIDIYVPGLIERVFGARLMAAASGKRGGQHRSRAKAAAAKANGAKGGRPRKRPSAA